jgi:hypothetical protein
MANKEQVLCSVCNGYFSTKYTLAVHKSGKHNAASNSMFQDAAQDSALLPFRDYIEKRVSKVRQDVAEFIDSREELENNREENEERDKLLNMNLFIRSDKILRALQRICEKLEIDISDITTSGYSESEDEEEEKLLS